MIVDAVDGRERSDLREAIGLGVEEVGSPGRMEDGADGWPYGIRDGY